MAYLLDQLALALDGASVFHIQPDGTPGGVASRLRAGAPAPDNRQVDADAAHAAFSRRFKKTPDCGLAALSVVITALSHSRFLRLTDGGDVSNNGFPARR